VLVVVQWVKGSQSINGKAVRSIPDYKIDTGAPPGFDDSALHAEYPDTKAYPDFILFHDAPGFRTTPSVRMRPMKHLPSTQVSTRTTWTSRSTCTIGLRSVFPSRPSSE
jgi:hypothetical protein